MPKTQSLAELKQFVADHPKHVSAQRQLAGALVQSEKWSEAIEVLEKLDQLWPADADAGGTLATLAIVYRKLERGEAEKKTLERIVSLSSDNLPALSRLIEILQQEKNWAELKKIANKLLAVQPLIGLGHNALAEAGKNTADFATVASAYAALLDLQPLDAGRLHYELAAAQFQLREFEQARSHVLIALEETPRYRVAQQLLLKLAQARRETAAGGLRAALPDLEGAPPKP